MKKNFALNFKTQTNMMSKTPNYDVGVPIDNCRFSVLHVIYVDILNVKPGTFSQGQLD